MKAVRLLTWRRLRAQPVRALVAALTVGAGVSVAVAVLIVLGSLRTSVHDAAAAHRLMESSAHIGKIVLVT